MAEKKLYRIDFTYDEVEEDGQVAFRSDVVFIGAESELDAIKELRGLDFLIREATLEETEAYVRGYEDGHDVAVVKQRLDKDASVKIDLADLSDSI
jgi:hypothetical protein